MIVDGRQIAKDIRTELAQKVQAIGRPVRLGIVMAGADGATEQYVKVKRRFAERIGVQFIEKRFGSEVTTEQLCAALVSLSAVTDGIVVQLPLPSQVITEQVVDMVPVGKDIDVLSDAGWRAFMSNTDGVLVPPVAGAVLEVLTRANVQLQGSDVVVVGAGKLVGQPVATLLGHKGATVQVLTKQTSHDELVRVLSQAAIVISGAGSPHLITPEMVKEDAVLIDAGTSESSGTIAGDIDPACAEKASVFTPVPGGIGPIAVAKLFENLMFVATNSSGR